MKFFLDGKEVPFFSANNGFTLFWTEKEVLLVWEFIPFFLNGKEVPLVRMDSLFFWTEKKSY